MQEIGELRQGIDGIDQTLVELLIKRAHLVEGIAAFKREHSLPTRDLNRERSQMTRISDLCQKLGASQFTLPVIFVFRHIMESSVILQGNHHPPDGSLYCVACEWRTAGVFTEGFDWPLCPRCRAPLIPIPK